MNRSWKKQDGLNRGLIFDNEIAAYQGCGQIHIQFNFAIKEASEAASSFEKIKVQVKQDIKKNLSKCESRIRDRGE